MFFGDNIAGCRNRQASLRWLPSLRGKVRKGVPVSRRNPPYPGARPSKGRKSEFRPAVRVGLLSALTILLAAQLTKASAQDKKLDSFTISYASVSGTRGPLWIAKDLGLF